jgi:hypothetical protein
MSISLCIPRAAEWASEQLVRSLFATAFHDIKGDLINCVIVHNRTDRTSHTEYKTIFVYFNYSTPQLLKFKENISAQGFTQFIFSYNFDINTYIIMNDSTHFKPSFNHQLYIWVVNE